MNKVNIGRAARAKPDVEGLIAGIQAGVPALSPSVPPRLDVEAVMQRVEAAVAKRREQDRQPGADIVARSLDPSTSPGHARDGVPWRSAVLLDVDKRTFTLDELLEASDRTFVETAYRALLRRPPELEGLAYHLGKLRSGAASKVEILGALRWSPEGLANSVHVDGLMVPYALRRWQRKRIVGPLIAWVHALFRLGSLPQRQELADAAAARETHELGTSLNDLARKVDERFSSDEVRSLQRWQAVEERLAAFPARLDQHDHRLEELASALEGRLDQVQVLEELASKLDDRISEARSASRKENLEAQHAVARLGSSLEKLSSGYKGVLDRLGSMQSHLETLIPFPAALVAAQQAIQQLGERQAETAAAVKAVAAIELQVHELRDQLRAELHDMRGAVQAESGQRVQQDAQLSRHSEELAGHAGLLQTHGEVLGQMEQAKASEQQDARALDPLYVAFEDRFRGSTELIRARAEPYVQLVLEAGVGSAAAPVLDLGCGGGDWLDVVRERGLVGHGIDGNRVFIELCRGRGLHVTEGDVIEVMRSLPDSSVGAVTGMHIAEHLPFEVLVRLLDEARRLLVPGGLLALETPNPENLQVATHLFYMDPTHRNPLPPEAFRWIVEARGFADARIERWSVARETGAPPLLDEGIPGAESTNVLLAQLAVAPDYAIIARRGSA